MSTKTNTHSLNIVAAVVVVCCLAGVAGADAWWTGAGGDLDWFNALNWDIQAVPAANDFTYVETATVVADQTVSIDDGGMIAALEADITFADLIVGHRTWADFALEANSTVSTQNLTIGEFEGSSGYFEHALPLTEADSQTHTNAFMITVGASGEGVLGVAKTFESGSVTAGLFHRSQGRVECVGSAVVREDLTVGAFGHATVNIADGGSLTCREAMLGVINGDASFGQVFVFEGGALTVSDHLTIGYSGRGSLNVEGSVTTGSALLGGRVSEDNYPGHGTAYISGMGLWDCQGDMFIGEEALGAITITGGGSVRTGDCYLGWSDNGSAQGSAYVFDGSSVHSANMFVGVYGSGILHVGDDSEVTVDDRIYVGQKVYSNGLCTLEGGRLTARGFYLGHDVGMGLDEDEGTGTLQINDPASVVEVSELFRLGQCSQIMADVGGTLILDGASLENESTSPADLAQLGNLEVIARSPAGEVVAIEAGLKNDGRGVKGRAHQNSFGTLRLEAGASVRLTDDVDNAIDSDRADAVYVDHLVLSAGASLDLAGLRLYYNTLTDEGGLVTGGDVTATEISGDVNCDGVVNLEDFATFKSNFGAGYRWRDGDLDEDGDVDLNDFVILKTNFGASAG